MKQRPPFSHKVKYETYPVLAVVSNCYPSLLGRLSTRYSPVRRSTRSPKELFSHDLHVLSTPPAFNLSQNQTLQLKNFEFDCTLQMYVCVVLFLPNSLFNCQRPWSLLRTINTILKCGSCQPCVCIFSENFRSTFRRSEGQFLSKPETRVNHFRDLF